MESHNINGILSKLMESPYRKFLDSFSLLKERNVFVHYEEGGILEFYSNESHVLEENKEFILNSLIERGIPYQKIGEVENVKIGYSFEVHILEKNVRKYCK